MQLFYSAIGIRQSAIIVFNTGIKVRHFINELAFDRKHLKEQRFFFFIKFIKTANKINKIKMNLRIILILHILLLTTTITIASTVHRQNDAYNFPPTRSKCKMD